MTLSMVSSLMLVVTTTCNLSCRYCYEGGRRSGEFMSLDTALCALDAAALGGKPFHVQFTGGEPLLAADLVFAVLEHIHAEALPVTTAIQTNGILLNRDAVRKFREHRTAVGISVDGLPGIQERMRGQSAATYRAMRILDDEGVPFSVTTVLSAVNTGELAKLAMALHSWPMASAIGLDLLVRKGSAFPGSGIEPPEEALLRQGIGGLLGTLDLLNRERRHPLVLREKQLVQRALKNAVPAAPYCSACTGASLAVTPGGELYPCTQTMGDPDFFLGTLARPDMSPFRTFAGASPVRGGCSGCVLEGRCPGDCPSRMHYNRGNQCDLVCTLYRTIYDYCKQTGEIPS